MTFQLAFMALAVLLTLAWFLGAIAPAFSRGPLAIGSAIGLVVLASLVLFTDIHYRLFDINGEYSLAIGLLAWLFLFVGVIGLTLGLLIRSKLRPFGILEENEE